MNCSNFNFNHDTPEDFVVSQWQRKQKSSKYLIYRWLQVVFCVGVLIQTLIQAGNRNALQFHAINLTNWGLWLNVLTSIYSAFLITAHYYDWIRINDNKMTPLLKTYWCVTNTNAVSSLFISTMYWSILHYYYIFAGGLNDLNNILTHAGNSIMIIIDLFVIRHPCRWQHFIYPEHIGISFVIFTIFFSFSGSHNEYGYPCVYPILDWKGRPGIAFVCSCFSIALAAIIQLVVFLIHKIRNKIYQYCKRPSQLSPLPQSDPDQNETKRFKVL